MDPVTFLAARLDEDEAAAKATEGPGTWEAVGEDVVIAAADPYWDGACVANATGAEAAHVARHDPARVLREVEAGRKILADYEGSLRDGYGVGVLRRAVGFLAAVYSDHPDYREEWKP